MTYIEELQQFYTWINENASHESKEQIIDTTKMKVMSLIQSLVAFPQCDNFSLLNV